MLRFAPLPLTLPSTHLFSNFIPTRISYKTSYYYLNLKPLLRDPPPHESALAISFSSHFRRLKSLSLSVISLALRDSRSGEEQSDNRALKTVLKLYTAIRKRNMTELSDIIAEECRCISNLIFTPQKFNGKQQVLNFFNSLMMSLGNSNIEFVVQPTMHDGLTVGVAWKLECKNTHTPLGEGFSFHICHVYQGKVVIRNVEMFLSEPIEPQQLKLMAAIVAIANKIGYAGLLRGKSMRVPLILLLSFAVVALFFS